MVDNDIFNMGDSELDEPTTGDTTPEETNEGPERKPCPDCGKEVTWTQAGRPRQHKCVDKAEAPEKVEQEAKPEPEGLVAKVIAKYLSDKAEIERKTKEFEESLKETKDLQNKRLEFLGTHMKKEGVTSQNTAYGRSEVYKVDSATMADPLIFTNWVSEDYENRKHYLENRVSKTAVKQGLSDGELVPPGVNYTTIEKVKVVRKSK
jgi:hypothetical protein